MGQFNVPGDNGMPWDPSESRFAIFMYIHSSISIIYQFRKKFYIEQNSCFQWWLVILGRLRCCRYATKLGGLVVIEAALNMNVKYHS